MNYVPDATLLMAALDKLSQPRGNVARQSAFRLSAIRANLMVDVNPTLEGVASPRRSLLKARRLSTEIWGEKWCSEDQRFSSWIEHWRRNWVSIP